MENSVRDMLAKHGENEIKHEYFLHPLLRWRLHSNFENGVEDPEFAPHVSSTYVAVPLDQDGTSPLILGERCNANGSKRFKELLLAENWEGIVVVVLTGETDKNLLKELKAYLEKTNEKYRPIQIGMFKSSGPSGKFFLVEK